MVFYNGSTTYCKFGPYLVIDSFGIFSSKMYHFSAKMNVLHHLSLQFEACIILLQESHCTSAMKLHVVLFSSELAESS